MSPLLIRHCLELLDEVDVVLMQQGEIALAAHLSLVVERLGERITPLGPRPPCPARILD